MLDVRDALQLTTGGASDRLSPHDQAEVADALGLLDADALLREVYEAARTISYASDVRLRTDLVRALDGGLDIAEGPAEREPAYVTSGRARRALAAPPPRVHVDSSESRRATVIDVRAQDAVGLLHRVGRALEASGAVTRSAHISTRGANAVETFYVTSPRREPLPVAEAGELARQVERSLAE